MFDPCIDRVVELIQGQIQQVERTKNRVKVRSKYPALSRASGLTRIH